MDSPKTIARLSLYRRLLSDCRAEQIERVYSHELARRAGVSAAQVRRDIMALGYSGTPNTGYDVQALAENISVHLDAPEGQQVAMVGIGNLGRAVLAYFSGRRAKLKIVAAFDTDPQKTGRVIHGCRCYDIDEIPRVMPDEDISVGIVTVPSAAAQDIADLLVRSGVQGLLNFAPVPLKVPKNVYVEHMDMAIALDKVAFFANKGTPIARGM